MVVAPLVHVNLAAGDHGFEVSCWIGHFAVARHVLTILPSAPRLSCLPLRRLGKKFFLLAIQSSLGVIERC